MKNKRSQISFYKTWEQHYQEEKKETFWKFDN